VVSSQLVLPVTVWVTFVPSASTQDLLRVSPRSTRDFRLVNSNDFELPPPDQTSEPSDLSLNEAPPLLLPEPLFEFVVVRFVVQDPVEFSAL